MEILNRRAKYNYFIEDEIEAGIVLKGTEIKSLRKGNADIKEAYAKIKDNEIYIINMYIAKYEASSLFNHEERRTRKLLMHKREIKKLKERVEQNGYTLIPLKVYVTDKAKILIGVGRGKKHYDKRATLKEKTINMEIKRKLGSG